MKPWSAPPLTIPEPTRLPPTRWRRKDWESWNLCRGRDGRFDCDQRPEWWRRTMSGDVIYACGIHRGRDFDG